VADARAGIQRAITAYVAGIEARNLSEMQRAFPSMPSNVQHNWSALFAAVKSIQAQASGVEIVQVDSDGGSANVSLTVSFPNPANKRPCTQVTPLRVRVARAGGGWRITALDQVGQGTSSAGCSG
jgi:Tfp pilus assembly protein PilW